MKRRFDFWHPSKGRLRHWLETGDPAGVGDHVEQCERCANQLEQLDDGVYDLDAPSPLRLALTAALTPPDDLNERVLHGVEVRRRADQELALFAGLFSIGMETAQLMIGSDHDHDSEPNRPTPDDTRPESTPGPGSTSGPERDDHEQGEAST